MPPRHEVPMTPKLHHLLPLGLALCTGCFDASTTSSMVDDTQGASETGMATSSDGSSDEGDGNDGSDAETSGTPQTGGEEADSSTGEPPDDTTDDTAADPPPEVVFFEPADGATQVYDPTVTIVFNEPVVQPSLEAAFPEGSDFSWSEDGTQVEFEIELPFEDVPVMHALEVPTSVTDLAGNALPEPFISTFELASLTTTTLPFEPDASTCCHGLFDFLLSGDADSNALFHAGISFPLAALPPSMLAVRSATLEATVTDLSGNIQDPAFGRFVVDHVAFAHRDEIDAPTLLETDFATMFEAGGAAEGAIAGIEVTDQLAASWDAEAESFQLRLHPEASNGDGMSDAILFAVTDPNMQPRVEVQYFE